MKPIKFKFQNEEQAHAFFDWFWFQVTKPVKRPRFTFEWSHTDKKSVTVFYNEVPKK